MKIANSLKALKKRDACRLQDRTPQGPHLRHQQEEPTLQSASGLIVTTSHEASPAPILIASARIDVLKKKHHNAVQRHDPAHNSRCQIDIRRSPRLCR